MLAPVAVSILMIGIRGQAMSERQDALLEQYRAQVTQVLQQASDSIRCYTDYVPRVDHESPTPSDVFSLDTCDEAYDADTLHLQNARNTARKSNFTRAQLFEQQLPFVLNTAQGDQDQHTAAFQTKLQQLRNAEDSAQKVFRAKRDVVIQAAKKVKSKVEGEGNGHAKEIAGAGVAVGGAAVTGGVVTFAPFVAKATELSDHVEKIEEAATATSAAMTRALQTPIRQVTLGQLKEIRTLVRDLRSDLMQANIKLLELVEHYESNVLEAEKPEALEVVSRHGEEITAVFNEYIYLDDLRSQMRQQVLQCT